MKHFKYEIVMVLNKVLNKETHSISFDPVWGNHLIIKNQVKLNNIGPFKLALTKILGNIDEPTEGLRLSRERWAMTVLFTVCLIFTVTITFSDQARSSAFALMDTIKTVFIYDFNRNRVVEKPGNYEFLQPLYVRNTKLSDEAISEKVGLRVTLPQNVYKEFTLRQRMEGVGLTKSIDYRAFSELRSVAEQAINNNDVFKSLEKYEPYRSIGGFYTDTTGATILVQVFNKTLNIPSEYISFKKTVQTKMGSAEWVSLSFPVYPGDDLTQKPTGVKSYTSLIWFKDNSTYQFWPQEGKTLSMWETIKFAEAFIDAQ